MAATKPKHTVTTADIVKRAKTDPAFLKRALANPNLRYRLPTAMLPAVQQAARVKARQPKAPNPNAVPSAEAVTARARRDPAFAARIAAGKLSYLLPDDLLPAAKLKSRQQQRFVADVGNVDDPLTGDSLVNAAKILAGRTYDQTISDIDQAEKSTIAERDEQLRRANAYLGQLTGLTGRQAELAPQTTAANVATTKAIGDAAAAAAADVVKGIQGRQADDRAARGELDGGATQQLNAQAAAQAQALATENAAAQARAQELGQAQQAILAGANVGTNQSAAATKLDISGKAGSLLGELAKKRVDAARKRGEDETSTLLTLRSSEADRELTRESLKNDAEKAILNAKTELAKITTNAELERWKAELAATLKREGYSSAEAIATANREAANNRQLTQIGATAAENAKNRAAAAKKAAADRAAALKRAKLAHSGKGGTKDNTVTPAEARKNADKRDGAFAAGRRLAAGGIDANEEAVLTSEYGPLLAQAVKEIAENGGRVTPATARKIKQRLGIDIPKKYL